MSEKRASNTQKYYDACEVTLVNRSMSFHPMGSFSKI